MALHLLIVAALVAVAHSASNGTDCGTVDTFVLGHLKKSFAFLPGANCTYEFGWRFAAGAFVELEIVGLDSDPNAVVSLYNLFAGGKALHFESSSNSLPIDVNQYFAPGELLLHAATGLSGRINVTITISVSDATLDAFVKYTQVITGMQPVVVSNNLIFGTTYIYTSTSKITFSTVNSIAATLGNATYFDSVFVYEGQGPEVKLLGSLAQILADVTHVTSSNALTIFPMSRATLQGKVIINNEQNIGGFISASVFNYLSHSNEYNTSAVEVDARQGPGTTTIVSFGAIDKAPADYPIITDIKFYESASILQVFSGFPTNKMAGHYIKQYTPSSVVNMPPQFFPGTSVTFSVNKGYALITFTSNLTPPATL